MAPTELEANCDLDVTIYLMENLSMEKQEAGSTSNKRRRTSVQESGSAQGAKLGQVKVKASRLRQCSTYFDTCMSERWAQSKVPSEMEFHLEVHTEVRYYEDCFSRMNYLYKPIGSVACCIELLKVASQIGFQALVDICVKCLEGIAWSDEDEKLVREFCTSAHLVPFDSLTELLSAHFHHCLPLTQEEQQEKLSLNAKDLFSCYLRNALPEESLLEGAALESRKRRRAKFAQAFHVVMSGVESGDVCDEVLEHIQALLMKALAKLLTRVQRELNDLPAGASAVEGVLSDMCWLFEVAREANAAQALVVKLLGEALGISIMLQSAIYTGDPRPLKVSQLKKWAAIIYALFQDVLEGRLFLSSFQRSTMSWHWHWLLRDVFLGLGDEHVKAVRVRIITSLPQAEQEKFWLGAHIGPEQGILWEAHRMWISRMVTRKVQLLQPQSTASSNEVRSKTQD